MQEIVYRVTRDAIDPEEENWDVVCLWEPHVVPKFEAQFTGSAPFWATDKPPVETMAADEFEERFLITPPAPGESMWIHTFCTWERCEFDG